jgi:hypothetical protein
MRVHTTHSDRAYVACLRRPNCPACGEGLFAASATEFIEGLVVHTWTCDACEHQFRTAVTVPGAQ